MRIQYRIRDGYAEIVRCFGMGETVVVPEKIGEITVRAVAAYTFSDKKSSEDQDVLEYRTEDGFLEEDREQLLAGEKIAEVVFPETIFFTDAGSLRNLRFLTGFTGSAAARLPAAENFGN